MAGEEDTNGGESERKSEARAEARREERGSVDPKPLQEG